MRSIITLAALVAATLPLAPAVARTMQGYTVGTTRLYAGPLPDYPTVRYVRRGAMVSVHGCLRDWSWCDVTYRANRGWIAGDLLVISYRGRRSRVAQDLGIGVIAFSFGAYWDSYYRGRDFYRERPRWQATYDSRYRPEWGERDRGSGMPQGQQRVQPRVQRAQQPRPGQNRQGPRPNSQPRVSTMQGRDNTRHAPERTAPGHDSHPGENHGGERNHEGQPHT